jgi:hypothetical protein
MYHVEMRQFPHNMCRFNLSAQELHVLVEPWSRGEWVEFGERKWSPHQAKLTILQGPQIPLAQLSMGRGWRTAQRQGDDVSEHVIEAAGAASAGAARRDAQRGSASVRHGGPGGGEQPGVDLRSLLGEDASALLEVWQLLAARHPEHRPSECLAAAEEAVRSLGASPS